MFRWIIASLSLLMLCSPAKAAGPASDCLAMAGQPVFLQLATLAEDQAQITYSGHSTFVIETPAGIRAATDYAGFGTDRPPDVATMNHAHSSHYTDNPDPAIRHVLRGWSDVPGTPASHDLKLDDLRVRNVTTDIRSGGGRQSDGNSIFIFETAGLCIGHLGHLHHELTPGHIGGIGRLDVVMVAVDGGLTMPVENVMAVLKQLNVRVILPMHARFAGSLERFIAAARPHFEIQQLTTNDLTVSAAALPARPTVFIMPGM
jgi:L-ascorbate metabolism protein UlaG (beta-lactamase superfamily)